MKKTGDAGPGQKSVGANVKMYAPAALLGHLRPAGRVRVRVGVGVGVGGRARDRPKLMNRDDGWRARRAPRWRVDPALQTLPTPHSPLAIAVLKISPNSPLTKAI